MPILFWEDYDDIIWEEELPKKTWFQILEEQIRDNFEEATFVGGVVFREMHQPWLHASYLNFVTGLVGY